jgi:hypothetical protein
MNNEDLIKLCKAILDDNEVLLSARRKAGKLINDDTAVMKNCCAATLSYLLIDVLKLDLMPTARAMKLAYILENEIGLQVIGASDEIMAGDIGVVNQPKVARILGSEADDSIEDGDADEDILLPMEQAEKYKGAGYVENDPNNKNWHHIYLVVEPNPVVNDKNLLLIADNQASMPHVRDIRGGERSKTNFFLRAPL